MRNPDNCYIEYCGYKEPRTPKELDFELVGLEIAIKEAEKRIKLLKQTALLVNMAIEEKKKNNDNSNSR